MKWTTRSLLCVADEKGQLFRIDQDSGGFIALGENTVKRFYDAFGSMTAAELAAEREGRILLTRTMFAKVGVV